MWLAAIKDSSSEAFRDKALVFIWLSKSGKQNRLRFNQEILQGPVRIQLSRMF
jgi:hypothetical protein